MTGSIRHVVVLGGGSAGWLTACRLAADHKAHHAEGLSVTLIESPDVPILGVGEGTWPTMPETLKRIGLSEAQFIRDCDASFKQGTGFVGWTTGQDNDRYYHPFMLPVADEQLALETRWQHHAPSYASAVTPQAAVCDARRAPKQLGVPEYSAALNYGYHLDAGKFAELLRKHATTQLGVRHILDHVTGIDCDPDGYISALATKQSGAISGDLFVDCSGFASLLIAQHYAVPLNDCSDILKNDSALAAQVPYAQADEPIASVTLSTAQEAGWIWDIGLPTRRGTGYVYASDYSDDDRAETVLRAYLARTATPDIAAAATVRKLSFSPGYRERFWVKNAVAVGMAAGFLEPLEASALVMVELAAEQLSEGLPRSREAMPMAAERFNNRFAKRWERIIDFLKLHYLMSERSDSPYWTDMRAPSSTPDRLLDRVAFWRLEAPSTLDFTQTREVFPAASYKYVLYGMGRAPDIAAPLSGQTDPEQMQKAFLHVRRQADKFVSGLPDNRTLIDDMCKRAPSPAQVSQ